MLNNHQYATNRKRAAGFLSCRKSQDGAGVNTPTNKTARRRPTEPHRLSTVHDKGYIMY